ncbi:MAG: hypothetical protein JEY99_06915 [Spirochaetales bacterium]|nr:hypothetical protein [Spirochaetales bacterium]
MKRVLLLLILFISLFSPFLYAETVMIFSIDSWYTKERRMGEEYIIYAIEDGLMDSLFDAGHIIYNDYADPLTIMDYTDRNRVSYRLARSGGASWLLELEIGYENEGEEINSLPDRIGFRFTNILEDEVLRFGEYAVSDFIMNTTDSDRDICKSIGIALATMVNGIL